MSGRYKRQSLRLALSLGILMLPCAALAQTTPKLSISPSSLIFSSTPNGAISAPKAVKITNSGGGFLQVSGVSITGSNAAEFAVTDACSASLPTKGSCTIAVTFSPTAVGSRSANLQITTSSGAKTISLRGTGTAPPQPAITVSPTSLSFASTATGLKSAGLTVKLTNTGKAPLQISSVMISNSQEFSGTQTCTSASVAPTGTCEITMYFTPNATGSRTGSVVIKSNIADKTISLTGTGIAPETITVSGRLEVNSGLLIDADTNDPRQIVTADNNSCSASQFANAPAVIGGYVSMVSTGKDGDRFARTTDKFDVYRTNLAAGSTVELTTANFDPSAASADVLYVGLLSSDCKTYLQSAAEDLRTKSILVRETGSYYLVVYAIKGSSNYVVRVLPPVAGVQSVKSGSIFEQPRFVDNEVLLSKAVTPDLKGALSGATRGAGGLFGRNSNRVSGLVINHDESSDIRAAVGKYFSEKAIPPGEIHDYGVTTLVKVNRQMAVAALKTEARMAPSESELSSARKEDTRSISEALGVRFDSAELQNYLEMSEVAQDLARRAGAKRGELNFVNTRQSISDPDAANQRWHYDAIKLSQAIGLYASNPKSDVIVAVIDSGLYSGHPDLAGQSVAGYDFIEDISQSLDGDGRDSNPDDPGSDGPYDVDYHGTHVAGTVAATYDNGIGGYGVAGVAGKTRVMSLRVCGNINCPGSAIVNAIRFAAGETVAGVKALRKADLINLSLGGSGECPQAYQDAIAAARAAGVIVIASAGNGYEKGNPSSSPANCPGVIAVGATGPGGARAHYSQVQDYVDIAAPGGDYRRIEFAQPNIFSTWASGKLRSTSDSRMPSHIAIQGTSMASPHVAGVAALMRSVWPAMTPSDFDSALVAGKLTSPIANAPAKTKEYGYGLLDAAKSVAYASERRQSSGAIVSYLSVDPAVIDFGTSGSTQALNVRRVGTAGVRDVSPLITARWLKISKSSSTSVSETYVLSVDRTNLAPGAYSVIVRVTDTTGLTQDVAVSAQVAASNSTSSSAAPIYVLVWDVGAQKTVAYVQVDPTTLKASDFSLKPLKSIGSYLLIAGSDSDNDSVICEIGELCSAWPIDEKLSGISASASTMNVKLTVGFENRSVASTRNAKVGGIWRGELAGSQIAVFTSETGALQAADQSLDATLWGFASASGSEIRVSYTAGDDGAVLGTGALIGDIEERRQITGDLVFTDNFGNKSSESGLKLTFIDLYRNASSLALVSGKWEGVNGESYEIDSSGRLSFSDVESGCKGSGQIRIINPAFNMYDLRFGLSGCTGSYAEFNNASITGLAVLDFTESASKPPMYFLGQNRIGSRVYPAILVANPVD
jgi:serine protease